jgi:2-polyprenyl-3-methyl-5-hydroxy-6-metoxy-1,4-benzoquinol methylase
MTDEVKAFYETYPYPHVQRFEKGRMEKYAQPLLAAARMKLSDLKGKNVLDVGCGTGEITCSMATCAKKVMGIDFSNHSIQKANALARKFNLTHTHFACEDLFHYSPAQKYDLVTSFGVLHHTPAFHSGFHRLAQWVKPNGILIVGFYHPWGGIEQRIEKWISKLRDGEDPSKRLARVEKRQGMRMNDHSKAFWADRIAHPRENYFRVGEVRRLFEEEGYEILGIQSHKPNWKVNHPNNELDILRFEIEILIRRKRFVIMAGKKGLE